MAEGWDTLRGHQRAAKPGVKDGTDDAKDEMAKLCANTFAHGPGEDVLKRLRAMTKEVVLGPNAPESALRFMEGQRYLVHLIENWTAKGLGKTRREFHDISLAHDE